MQLAAEYLEFARQAYDRQGKQALDLSDGFIEANLRNLALRVRRFTSRHTPQEDINVAQMQLKSAAKAMLQDIPDARLVAIVTIAAEDPSDPRLLAFTASLANMRL